MDLASIGAFEWLTFGIAAYGAVVATWAAYQGHVAQQRKVTLELTDDTRLWLVNFHYDFVNGYLARVAAPQCAILEIALVIGNPSRLPTAITKIDAQIVGRRLTALVSDYASLWYRGLCERNGPYLDRANFLAESARLEASAQPTTVRLMARIDGAPPRREDKIRLAIVVVDDAKNKYVLKTTVRRRQDCFHSFSSQESTSQPVSR